MSNYPCKAFTNVKIKNQAKFYRLNTTRASTPNIRSTLSKSNPVKPLNFCFISSAAILCLAIYFVIVAPFPLHCLREQLFSFVAPFCYNDTKESLIVILIRHSLGNIHHASLGLKLQPCLFPHSDPETRETGLTARFQQDQSPANPHPFHYPAAVQPQAPVQPQSTGAAQHAPSQDSSTQAAVQPPAAAGTPVHPAGSSKACGRDGRSRAAWVHPPGDRPQRL